MKWFIYALLDEFGEVRYIGKSDDPEWRLVIHWRIRNREENYKSHWLRTLTYPPRLKILDEGTGPWQDTERFWIAFYRDEVGARLTNLTEGGEGTSGYRFSDEQRRKISEAMKDIPKDSQWREKLSRSQAGKPRFRKRSVAIVPNSSDNVVREKTN